jgi:glycine/D-amino acid oxidase-like deaminating enzyme
MNRIEADLAIVGAGIIGASAAYHASKRGLKVALLDAAVPASGTSGACDGYVAISSKKPGLMMQLAAASQQLYPQVAADLRLDPELEPAGGLLICETRRVREQIEGQVAAIEAAGVAMPFCEGEALRRIEPHLSADIYGAYDIPGESIVNPYRMTLALVDGAIARGARTFWHTKPVGFDIAGDRITRMDTTAGEIVARNYLFAAGVWSAKLGTMVGIDLPIVPRRGELVVTERGAALARRYLQSGLYIAAKADPEYAKRDDPLARLGHGFCLEVNAQGQCIIGSTRAFVGYDRRTTPEGVAAIVREAVKRVPALARVRMLRCFAGLRPYVPDGKPIIGRSGRLKNLLVGTGHEGDGISLSQITGDILADLAADRPPRIDVSYLSPDRFAAARLAAA